MLNPLRANMVNEIGDWRCSSYPAMIGAAPTPDWLQPAWLLRQFDSQRKKARKEYVDFVRAGVGFPSLWASLRGQIFLGSEAFIARMHATVSSEQSLDEVPRMQRRLPAMPLDSYREDYANSLHLGMAFAYLSGDYSMKAIADTFNVHYTTASRAVSNYDLNKLH